MAQRRPAPGMCPTLTRTHEGYVRALLHLAVMTAKLRRPGGVRTAIAENLMLKQQLIVLRRRASARRT